MSRDSAKSTATAAVSAWSTAYPASSGTTRTVTSPSTSSKHPSVLLDDVLAYRELRRNRRYEALAATAVDIDAADDMEVVRERLREARRVVAERRRAASSGVEAATR